MQLTMTQTARLEQTLSPRLITYYELLACPLADLEAEISRQVAENPALELIEAPAPPLPRGSLDWAGDDFVTRLPAPVTLRDHLRRHLLAAARTELERRVGLYLIEEINDDGYLEAGIGEVAVLLGVSVVTVETVLGLVQSLDPPGIGARDLRECLELQLRHHAAEGRRHALAERLVADAWEAFSTHRLAACARRLRTTAGAVEEASDFLRRCCLPYPGRLFAPPGNAGATAPPARAEVLVRCRPTGEPPYMALTVSSRRFELAIDRTYRDLDEAARAGAAVAPDDALHVRTLVTAAREFIAHLRRRTETVRLVTEYAANAQAAFIERGPAYLQPLTRLTVAYSLGVHESTVGRAVHGKHVELPQGSIVPLATFFDGAQPLRLALEQLVASEDKRRPWSDQELAERLAERGFEVARRTVAKYRGMMRIGGAQQRRKME
jgi:RNA polymerase sigma-54 factor